MNEISIIINGVRYDAVPIERFWTNPCASCALEDAECVLFDHCPCPDKMVFQKSNKSFEK